ncbi:MAG: DnaD domain protein [Desulfotomaculum sp.]|nr:DnaD domain protein [Desulfotomaculum sp.]
MPKGDREFFKADTDDGYTTIANLLLEALAMAKLSGVQKDDQITLKEFAQACGTSEAYVSRQLKQLVNWNIVLRTTYEPGKAPRYTINTRVAEWDKGCINVQGLHECEIQGLYKCASQGLHKCARVNQARAQESQGSEPPLNKVLNKNKKNNDVDDDNARTRVITENTGIVNTFENEFGRPLSSMEIQQLIAWLEDDKLTDELLIEALKRASLAGRLNFAYIRGIINNWLKNNVRTLREVQERDKQFKERKERSSKGVGRSPPDVERSWKDSCSEDRKKMYDALLMS